MFGYHGFAVLTVEQMEFFCIERKHFYRAYKSSFHENNTFFLKHHDEQQEIFHFIFVVKSKLFF